MTKPIKGLLTSTKMIIERTQDEAVIISVVTHPKVYPWICEDGAPSPENWHPVIADSVYYLLAKEITKQNPIVLGLFAVVPSTTSCVYQIHTCLLPISWGPMAKHAAKELLNWIWINLPNCTRVVGEVPRFNRLALKFGFDAYGMKQFGINQKAFLKKGKLHDVIMLGVTKPGV
jgi:hypothetical protein